MLFPNSILFIIYLSNLTYLLFFSSSQVSSIWLLRISVNGRIVTFLTILRLVRANRFEHRDALTGVERFNRDSINWKNCLHSSSKNYERQKNILKTWFDKPDSIASILVLIIHLYENCFIDLFWITSIILRLIRKG